MARQNRWATFGQAFNAVYDVGTSLGSSIESGKIAIKDYKDEEGNKLTGLALDRAKMDDYAAVEQKYGDPMEALKMRTGVEVLGQNRLKTNYDADTYDERVYQGGAGATAQLNAGIANTQSATGLNVANTGLVNEKTRGMGYDNNFNRDTLVTRTALGNSRNARDRTQAIKQRNAYFDPSYEGGLIAKQEQGEAEAELATSTADLQRTVIDNPIYQANFIAAEKAKMGKTATMAQLEEQIANDPQTLQLAEQNLELALTTTMAAVNNAQTELNLSNSADFQAAQYNAGLSKAELGAVQGEEAVLLAQQSLAANTFIREWSKTGNPDDPTSMRNLIKGISQINPMMGQKLSQDYGEHELWEITNRSLRMKAETNEALQNRGAAGAQELLDKYNGDDFGIRMDTNSDDGSMSMVETDKDGNVVRTIASGADERAFMQDLNAALDPASLMEYSMNLVDMDYKRALTQYNEAQATAALSGKALSATDQAFNIARDPKASAMDKKLALAFLMRDSPELYTQLVGDMNVQGLIDGASGKGDNVVPDQLIAPVVATDPVTEQEETTASQLMEALLSANATDREALLKGRNAEILAKVAPDFLVMEKNKTKLADFMMSGVANGSIKLTPEGFEELIAKYQRASELEDRGGQGKQARQQGRDQLATYAKLLGERPTEVLQVLIQSIKAKVKPEGGGGHSGRNAKVNNKKYNAQLAGLEQLIAAMDGR